MSYRTLDEMITAFDQLKAMYPQDITSEIIGYSVQNKPIYAFKLGSISGGKVLFNACIHGVEVVNGELMYQYARWLVERRELEAARIMTRNQTIMVPIFNVDEYTIRRKNAHNVDLNRNFEKGWCQQGSTDPTRYDYKGTAALTEPESQQLHSFIQTEKPAWMIDMHSGNPYIIYYEATDPNVSHISAVLQRFQQLWTTRGVQGQTYSLQGYGTGGRAADCAFNHGAFSLLWEFHPEEVTLHPKSGLPNPDPPFSDIEPIWLPKFLAMAIAVSQDCETIVSQKWRFAHWQDGDTNPTKTIVA